ncbi:SCO7613 C-terminal domain-containing membrane protein, partial [Streptomyces mesophilus]|uniref:SCO7613 C-terminal domain-containing membrane protein n=1 Tax=Streptomyces mesophilus TaxID=1775132 RepID=UPI0033585787
AVGAAAALWAALATLPLSLRLAHAAELTAHLTPAALALTAALLAARSLSPEAVPRPAADEAPRPSTAVGPGRALAITALACFFASALTATLLALATEAATFTTLGLLLTLTIAATALHPHGAAQSTLAVTAVATATGLALAITSAGELPAHQAAFALLAIPAATALLGARLRTEPYALPMELAGAAAAVLALGLASTDAPALSLTLALSGVIASATALRADRRPSAAYLAGALFLLATWVRLAASDITTPEAYTLPVTVPALVIGLLRRRRDTGASSWTAYGPGLAVTLLPSLAAAWSDPHWLRPLLLGSAALLVTLLGARHRLQAPLALGGLTLALVALHELAPYVVQVVGALPRWLPPAAAGMLLLTLGATYEQRLRNARRLRELVGRMQ